MASRARPGRASYWVSKFKRRRHTLDKKDFTACVKEIRPLASLIAVEMDLSKYQATYDIENQKMPTPAYKVMDLIPPIRKHTFTPEVDPSELIDDKAKFQALCGIDWSSPNFQTTKEDEEPARDDPEASNCQGQEN